MKKGFTLIELLIVIAIIAILAVVVVLTINPAELLRQGRDATRVSDMGTINKAVSLYYQDAMNNPSTMFMGTSSIIYVSVPDPTATSTNQCTGLGLPTPPTGYTYQCAASSTYMKTDGTGWVPINFNAYSAGSVISKLPVDPVNTTSTNLYYTYETDGIGGFKIAAFFESQKDAPQMANDSGNDPELYEKGSNLALASGRGLVGYWPMDEGTGSSSGASPTADMSGSSNTGTWYGTAAGTNSTYYSAGKVGAWAGYFNGGNNYINVGGGSSIRPVGSITIAGWINPRSFTQYSTVVSANSEGYLWGYFSTGGTPNFYIWNSVGSWSSVSSASALSTNTWQYLAGTFDGQYLRIFINGVQTGVTNLGTSGNTIGYVSNNTYIGNYGNFYFFPGAIDEIRIYNRALSATEIQEMYNAEK